MANIKDYWYGRVFQCKSFPVITELTGKETGQFYFICIFCQKHFPDSSIISHHNCSGQEETRVYYLNETCFSGTDYWVKNEGFSK
jgi:hypothetical protein